MDHNILPALISLRFDLSLPNLITSVFFWHPIFLKFEIVVFLIVLLKVIDGPCGIVHTTTNERSEERRW